MGATAQPKPKSSKTGPIHESLRLAGDDGERDRRMDVLNPYTGDVVGKGTMNALFLKDLAMKTHRGLEGRVRQGKSGGGNAYGYDVVKRVRNPSTMRIAGPKLPRPFAH